MTENDNDLPAYSHWNHRVVKREHDLGGEKEVTYGIHEVYYTADEKKPAAVTEKPIPVYAESMEGLQQVLKWMQDALAKPILDYDKDFPQ